MSVSRGLRDIFSPTVAISLIITVGCFALPVAAQSNNPLKKIASMMPSGPATAPASYGTTKMKAPGFQMPQLKMPQMQNTMASVPQMQMPQMPQLQMPQVQMQMPQMPKLNFPSGQGTMNGFSGGMNQGGPMAMIDKWNASVANFMAKAKQKLTLPQMRSPQLSLPFANQSGGSLFPSLTQPKPPAQPPTLQNWLGQPRPQ